MIYIVCKYSCALCGLRRAQVRVPARGEESILDWVNKVAAVAISQDHAQRSPNCPSREMSELMIPISGAEKVGGPSVQ